MRQELMLARGPDALLDGGSRPRAYPNFVWDTHTGHLLGFPPVLAFAGRLILPVALTAGAVVGSGIALKDVLGIDPGRIPLAATLGGVSAAAFVLADVLPDGVRPFSYLAGIGGAVGALIVLFTSPKAPEAGIAPGAPPTVPPGQEVPTDLPAGEFVTEVLDLSINPEQPDTGGTTRFMYIGQTYAFTAINLTGRTLSFFAGLRIFNLDQALVYSSPPSARVLVTVPSGQAVVAQVSHPALGPDRIFLPQSLAVEAEIFRAREDAVAVARTASITIKYSWTG